MSRLIVFIFLFSTFLSYAQESDSIQSSSDYENVVVDTSAVEDDSTAAVDLYTDYSAPADSLAVQSKNFDAATLERLKQDPDMRYQQPPSVAESLWQRIVRWIIDFIVSLLDGAMNTTWGNVIMYAIGVVLMVVIIMMLLKVNAFRVLYNAQGSARGGGIEENIHEMNFEHLIEEAISQHDYRRGVRLLFLFALKMLSDKHLIKWESGKTNHEYVSELQTNELRSGLNELSFYFDYAWYGNFEITAETYHKAALIFSVWKEKVKP